MLPEERALITGSRAVPLSLLPSQLATWLAGVALIGVSGTAVRAQQPVSVAPAGSVPLPEADIPDEATIGKPDEMDDIPGIGIDWPDTDAVSSASNGTELPQADIAGPPPATEGMSKLDEPALSVTDRDDTAPSTEIVDDGSERRYAISVNGLDNIADDMFRMRFDELSLLKEGKGKPANIAQINRRRKEDTKLLVQLMNAKGYYAARIRSSLRAEGDDPTSRITVNFDVVPGQLYTLSQVTVTGLSDAVLKVPALASAFPVAVGDPLDADKILAAHKKLATTLSESGFPFAKVDEPVVEIDHEVRRGELDMATAPGGYRVFGDIVIAPSNKRRIFTSRHLQRIARFRPGDHYTASEVEDLRRAIITTGLVSSVAITPVDVGDDEHVNMNVAVSPAPMRTIAGEVGFGTGEGYQAEVSWQHRNFFPPEGGITLRGLVGTKEQLASVVYRRNNFRRRDHVLHASIVAQHTNYAAYSARTLTLSSSLEKQTNIIFQKKWVWNTGVEFIASRERDLFGSNVVRDDRTYLIAALPSGLTYDGSDNLLDPSRGFRLGARISPEIAKQGAAFGYVRGQIDASVYMPASDGVVIASRVRAGSIIGSNADRIAPSRRFYAGGGASVRGYAYQAIGPRDANDDPVGGKSLLEFSLEARIRLGNFGITPFVDAGTISTNFLPKIQDMRYGAGLGVRYYSSFGPIRIDVGTPLNRQSGESRIAVYVSLGQAF